MQKNKYYNLICWLLSGLFLAIGMVIPIFTGQLREIGRMLLPMHIPVMLCSLILGEKYGFFVGLVLPILRSFVFGMPILYPQAVGMSFELLTYGFFAGYLYKNSRHKCIISLYRSLILTMIIGRVVWGMVSVILYGVVGKIFTFSFFITTTLLTGIPGIILQLILIPTIMMIMEKTCLVRFEEKNKVVVKKEFI